MPRASIARRTARLAAFWTLSAGALRLLATPPDAFARGPVAPDPLPGAIARLQVLARTPSPGDEETAAIRASVGPLLEDAALALSEGARWLALSRLERVFTTVVATEYRSGIATDLRGQMDALQREWTRLGPELGQRLTPGPRPAFEPLPASTRALAEAALAQMPIYYAASLDYGRNTAPDYGLYYLGEARAERELLALLAAMPRRPAEQPALAPRAVDAEIAELRDELLAAYIPPRSIDSHDLFIRISSLLKEADELSALESRYGALLRLLDARARFSRFMHPGRTLSGEEALRRGEAVSARLDESPRDTSLQRLFLETALFSARHADRIQGGGEIAAAIFEDVLPRFPQLLGPAPPRPAERLAEATVTLVRWPYT